MFITIRQQTYKVLFTIEPAAISKLWKAGVTGSQVHKPREVTCYIIPKPKTDYVDAVVKRTVSCDSRDVFRKTEGRRRALRNCLQVLEVSREERTLIWEEFRNTYRQPAGRANVGTVKKLRNKVKELEDQIASMRATQETGYFTNDPIGLAVVAEAWNPGSIEERTGGMLTSGQSNPDPRTLSKSTGVSEGY